MKNREQSLPGLGGQEELQEQCALEGTWVNLLGRWSASCHDKDVVYVGVYIGQKLYRFMHFNMCNFYPPSKKKQLESPLNYQTRDKQTKWYKNGIMMIIVEAEWLVQGVHHSIFPWYMFDIYYDIKF